MKVDNTGSARINWEGGRRGDAVDALSQKPKRFQERDEDDEHMIRTSMMMRTMLKGKKALCAGASGTCALLLAVPAVAACPEDFPEPPAIERHVEQSEIVGGDLSFADVRDAGRHLFEVKFNICDGQGRPATTGGGVKRVADQPSFIRTSSPEADSCAGCHAQPFPGGAGDFVANVFVLAQRIDPVTESVSSEFSNERNTLGMHGSGAIEMLAREMTTDLQAQAAALPDGAHTLTTKGVDFAIRKINGQVVESEGINRDLIVRPFFQSGVLVSLRQFTVDASNHHHGMQAEERFDLNPGRGFDPDFDEDGVKRELTVGDITALTVWQASLAAPQQILPRNPRNRWQVRRGQLLFADIGCASCHKPALPLESPLFSEPNPFNPEGTFRDLSQSVTWDMTEQGGAPRLRKNRDGTVTVHAYTDLKRHDLCDDQSTQNPIRFYCNEKLAQDRPDQGGHPGAEFFLTRKLWDVGSSAPYGHRGDITTITEAILYHGGEGRHSRDAFAALPASDRRAVVSFLKTLQVVESSQ